MTGRRFRAIVMRRWVFDAAALRRQRRASAILFGAYDHIVRTHTGDLDIDLDRASFDALQIIRAASDRVCSAFDDANRAAAEREGARS